MSDAQLYHLPVLLKQSVDALRVGAGGTYVDATFGGGGHSREVLRRMSDRGHLYSIDQDADALANAAGMDTDERFTLLRGNFRFLGNFLRYEGVTQVDGILADLGVSSHQFDEGRRGFSFRFDAPLDMRMNQRASRTAADVVNGYDERQLAKLFRLYGELRPASALAKALVRAREQAPITTTGQLATLASGVLGRTGGSNLPRVFQALRIEVNDELGALRQMLKQAVRLLRPGARLVVITYHSLEDRLVKNLIRTGNCEGEVAVDFYGNVHTPLRAVGKPITPSEEEIGANPRSRSARLRVGEKI